MTKPLVAVALTGFAISVVCFLGAGAMVATAAASNIPFGEIFAFGEDRERCVNDRGDEGAAQILRRFDWTSGSGLYLNGSGTMRYRDGSADLAEARGPAYLLDHMEVYEETIRYDCDPRGDARSVDIEFAGDGVREFVVRGSGDMVLENLEEGAIEMTIAGSGSITATGNVDEISLTIAGSGDADLGGLTAREMHVTIAGSGDAIIAPLDSVEISIAGSGDVEMRTDPPDVSSSIMGSGRVSVPPATN